MAIPGLVLEIFDCRCTCGNKWTHSRPLFCTADGGYGGTPSLRQEAELKIVKIYNAPRDFACCFRCGPLAIDHSSWTKIITTPGRSPVPPASPPAATPSPDPFNFAQELGLTKEEKDAKAT